MIKGFNKVVIIDIYNTGILFSVNQSDKKLTKIIKDYEFPDEQKVIDDIFDEKGNHTYTHKDGSIIIRLIDFDFDSLSYGVLAHEIFHAADILLEHKGLILTEGSEEAYAYLIGYITKEFYDFIETNRSSKK